MTDNDYKDFDGEIDDDEDLDKEAKYQELVSGWEAELFVLSEEELLLSVDYFIDEFTALGDYKDSAERAEECLQKLKELRNKFPEDEEEPTPSKPEITSVGGKREEPSFGGKHEELKAQIAALNETVKKDEEKIANLKNELSKINLQDPEAVLRQQKRNKVAIPLTSIFGILCLIVGGVLIGIGELEIIIPGIFCELFAISLLISSLALWYSGKKMDPNSAERVIEKRNRLSTELTEANKTAEEHRSELQAKQVELDRYLLGL